MTDAEMVKQNAKTLNAMLASSGLEGPKRLTAEIFAAISRMETEVTRLRAEVWRYEKALGAIEGDDEGREFVANGRDQHQDIARAALTPEPTEEPE